MTAGRFDPTELAPSDGASPSDAELAQATRIGRELERYRGASEVRPSAEFADRVMAAVAAEPPPVAAGWLRGWRPASALASFRDAWRVAVGGPGRPMSVRAGALAYVLIAVIGLTAIGGAAAFGVAGALGVFDASPSPSPSLPPPSALPSPSPAPVTPTPSIEPSPGASEEPTNSTDPTGEPSQSPESPGASPADSAAPTGNPSEEPDGSDDHGGGSSPSPSATETPKPSGLDDSG